MRFPASCICAYLMLILCWMMPLQRGEKNTESFTNRDEFLDRNIKDMAPLIRFFLLFSKLF